MHRPLAALAVAALVVLSGCSDAQPQQQRPQQPPRDAPAAQAPAPVITTITPTPTGTLTPTPTPSTPPLSREQAAKRYLAIVRPYNQALERLEKAVNSGEPLPTLKALGAQVAEANETRIHQLQTTPWPADVRAPVQELVAQAQIALASLRRIATAKTREELASLVLRAGRYDGAKAAAEIRRLLKLSQYDEEHYS